MFDVVLLTEPRSSLVVLQGFDCEESHWAVVRPVLNLTLQLLCGNVHGQVEDMSPSRIHLGRR